MASESEVIQLLEGVVADDACAAFGLSHLLPPAKLRRECRRIQALFHEDKGNATCLSQLANDCAAVICGRQFVLTSCLRSTAQTMLHALVTKHEFATFKENLKAWAQRRRDNHYAHVTSPERVQKAELLVGTMECVPRSQATAYIDLKKLFQRTFTFTPQEACWLMQKVGLHSVANSHRVKVVSKGKTGLRLPTKTGDSTECPVCGFCWKMAAPNCATPHETSSHAAQDSFHS